jgi:predicted nuclease of restriction endonuclease-like (RecB) superfamily
MPGWYPELLASIVQRVAVGRRRAIAAANQELVATYWAIGRDILDRQEAEGYGTKVIDRLSADLRREFPEVRGFSPRNLKYMRAFASAWPDVKVVQAPLAQLPWYHQITLIEKLGDPDLRLWYGAQAVEHGWSRDVLALQIERRLHQRSGKAITNFVDALPPEDSDLAQQSTKDPYLFDFVGVADRRIERDLQRGLIEHMENFLLELGQGFAFVGQQVRLVVGGDEFYADLLFYHLRLRCYVVIELKSVKFSPDYLGQLSMYMSAVDDLLAHPDDKPTIGLLLCRTKNNVAAEWALRGFKSPIGVATWATDLTDSLPEELATSLPSIEELEAELAASDEGDAT